MDCVLDREVQNCYEFIVRVRDKDYEVIVVVIIYFNDKNDNRLKVIFFS